MRVSRPLFIFQDVLRCRVHQRDGRRWYTYTDNNQRPNAYPPSSNSTNPSVDSAVEIDPASSPTPSSRKVEPFDLPRVVIDLDAVDSPYVVAARPRRPRHAPARDMRKPTQPFPRQTHELKFGATPPEILAYALLGDSSHSNTLQSKFMQTLLHAQRIQKTATEQDHINNLALDLQLDPVDRLKDAGFVFPYNSNDWIEQRILHVNDIVELRRMVDILSTTLGGCQILNHHLAEASRRILNLRQEVGYTGRKATSSEMLCLLNDTCINIISRGLKLHPHLATLALYHASQCESLPAIRQYLSLSDGQAWQFGRAMRHLQMCLVRTKKSTPATSSILPWMGKEARQKELLKLLTGWKHGHKPTQGESRGLSFALLAPVFSSNHSYYLLGLGEAGLCETLNAEWKNRYQENTLSKFLLQSQIFAMAHLLANNPRTSASILAAIPSSMKKFNVNTAQYQDLAQGKYHTSTRVLLCDVPKRIKHNVFQHYNFHGVRASATLDSHCQRTIERVQHLIRFDPAKAFRELDSLLVLGFSARGSQSPLHITWGDIPAAVKEGTDLEEASETRPGEAQDPLRVKVEKTGKLLGDKTIPGLSSGMCGLLKIREWSELSDESGGSMLKGLVVSSPTNGPSLYEKPFVRSDMVDKGE